MSVREGRGPDRNRNRGREVGPFPDGGGVRAPPPHAPPPTREGRRPSPPLGPWQLRSLAVSGCRPPTR